MPSNSRPVNAALVLIGRALFALVFLVGAPKLFSPAVAGYAAQKGVPLASLAVPAAGLISLVGALSVLAGYRARLGAWLLVLFLVPVTFMMHNFWAIHDPMAAQIEQASFLKNIALIGTALLITQFGSGPWSIDAKRP